MESEEENVLLYQKLDTGLNADSVEFCPYEGWEDILLCGTYKLEEPSEQQVDLRKTTDGVVSNEENTSQPENQTRVGGVTVYKLSEGDGKPQLSSVGQYKMCGVLDIKWPEMQINSKCLFGLVDAEGYFQVFELRGEGSNPEPVSKKLLTESSLGLSLGWDGGKDRPSSKVVASDSKGYITVFDIADGSFTVDSTWCAHDYEAWIAAFHNFDSNVVYTGGDDCRLKGWDLRDTSRPSFVSRKHSMGVCSIQSHPFDDHIYATGSYDEELFIWDRRQQKQPVTSTKLGGGIWRIKWDPFKGHNILTATMYNGTHIVKCDQLDLNPLPIVATHGGHNLAYGADWCRRGKAQLSTDGLSSKEGSASCFTNSLIATCSFYDHSLHLWEWNCDVK